MPDQPDVFRAYLHVATFCEKVLRETDGVMSVIRIFDRFNVMGDSEQMPPTSFSFMVLIGFKSGFMRGKQTIRLKPISPTGKELPAMEIPMLFEGDDDRGNAIAFQMNWVAEEEGVFWWDVYLNDELVTRMPLRVFYQRQRTPIPGN
jgi:hypothetical protein